MEFKDFMRGDIDVKLPAWAMLEIWNILHEIEHTESYDAEDIKELQKILDAKVNSIERCIDYQKKNYGFSKYDVR